MKKTILASLLVSAVVLTTAVPALAAPVEKPTTGTATFTVDADEEGVVVAPDTDEDVIVPDGGNSSKGPLRIQWVPDLDFGSINIQSVEQNIPAKWNTRDAGAVKMPAFAQVSDTRGENKGFKLGVTATVFETDSLTAKDKTLDNTRIHLAEAQQFVTNLEAAEVSTVLTALSATPVAPLVLDGDMTYLLETEAGQTIEGKQASVVFNNDYKGTGWTAAGETNSGIQLNIPSKDVPENGITYTSTLNWTLEDTI